MTATDKQNALKQAVDELRVAGFTVISIMATHSDGETVTAIKFDNKHISKNRGLGKTMQKINTDHKKSDKRVGVI